MFWDTWTTLLTLQKEEFVNITNDNEAGLKRKELEDDVYILAQQCSPEKLFFGVTALLMLKLKKQTDIFAQQIRARGGKIVQDWTTAVTHIITDFRVENVLRKIGLSHVDCVFVSPEWVSQTLKQQEILNTAPYRLIAQPALKKPKSSPSTPHSTKIQIETVETSNVSLSKAPQVDFLHGQTSDGEDDAVDDGADTDLISKLHTFQSKPIRGKFACATACESPVKSVNDHIIVELEKLKKTNASIGDKWRQLGYSKAIGAISRYPRLITSQDEAMKIHGVGTSIAEKIGELIDSGVISKVESFESNERVQTINLFQGIFGVGPVIASELYDRGYSTLEQLASPSSQLTANQRVGLQFYYEFKQRIPRGEVAEIEQIVCNTLNQIRPGSIAVCAGSYRRGKDTCGDIDILITHRRADEHRGLLRHLVNKLHNIGLLTHDLVLSDQDKYFGVGRLPGGIHRRIDLLVVPYAEFPFALLYFTGNDHFNRSMRKLCHDKNMHLRQKGLWMNIIRVRGEIINQGVPVPNINCEADIFNAIGIKYLEPHERNP